MSLYLGGRLRVVPPTIGIDSIRPRRGETHLDLPIAVIEQGPRPVDLYVDVGLVFDVHGERLEPSPAPRIERTPEMLAAFGDSAEQVPITRRHRPAERRHPTEPIAW